MMWKVTRTVFAESDLILTELQGAKGEGTEFMNTNLSHFDLIVRRVAWVTFRDSLIWGGEFRDAKLPRADFSMANLASARFERANLTDTSFYFVNLCGAVDFSRADIRGVNFSQALLQRLQISAMLSMRWMPNSRIRTGEKLTCLLSLGRSLSKWK